MKTKVFGNKKIAIRELTQRDLRNAKKFQDFINSLIKEGAQILMNKKVSLKEEKEWLKGQLKEMKKHRNIVLLAEIEDKIIGIVDVHLNVGRQEHVGNLGISIRKGYREIGWGTYLMGEIIKLAKKELKPKPKMLRLNVLPTNKPALNLYRKYGFKKVAVVPRQLKFQGKFRDEIIMLLYL